jgi:hypothetical protein
MREGPALPSTVIKSFDELIRHISSYRSKLPGNDIIQMNITMTSETAEAMIRYFCNNYIFYPQIEDGPISMPGPPINER